MWEAGILFQSLFKDSRGRKIGNDRTSNLDGSVRSESQLQREGMMGVFSKLNSNFETKRSCEVANVDDSKGPSG